MNAFHANHENQTKAPCTWKTVKSHSIFHLEKKIKVKQTVLATCGKKLVDRICCPVYPMYIAGSLFVTSKHAKYLPALAPKMYLETRIAVTVCGEKAL